MASKPRASSVASGLLARPGSAPARTTPVEDLPRPLPPAPPPPTHPAPAAPAAAEKRGGGIKAETVGTTVYLLPAEARRIKRLALDLDVPSVHELVLMGLDRLLQEHGQQPVQRYSAPRARKG